MLWILSVIGGIGAFIYFLFLIASLCQLDLDDVRYWGIRMIICIVAMLVGLFGFSGINSLSYDEVVQTGSWKIVSIADNSQISSKGSGRLFYVNAHIDTNEVYSFYYQVNDGNFKMGKVDADVTTICEKDNCTPHIVEYTTYTKNKMNRILQILLTLAYKNSSQKTYEIYVPTGTIFMTFDLDSQ